MDPLVGKLSKLREGDAGNGVKESVDRALRCVAISPYQLFEQPAFPFSDAQLFAFWAVVASTVSVVLAVVALPMLLTSMHSLSADIAHEADFCRLRIRDFWHEMYALHHSDLSIEHLIEEDGEEGVRLGEAGPSPVLHHGQRVTREKRNWMFGHYIPEGSSGGYAPPPVSVASRPSAGDEDPYSQAPSSSNPYSSGSAPNEYGINISRENGTVPASNLGGKEASKSASSGIDAYGGGGGGGGASPPSIAPPSDNPYASPPSAQPPPPTMKEKKARVRNTQCSYVPQPGPPGPPGEPGEDGRNGADGVPGKPGGSGRDGSVMKAEGVQKDPCVICPTGSSGPVGPQGPKGPTGPRGSNGMPGIDGKRGEPGMQGPPGPAGLTGLPGPQGGIGAIGRQFIRDGLRGPAGSPGPRGVPGLAGCQGLPGKSIVGPKGENGSPGRPGRDGHKGAQGPPGMPGPRGSDGDCSHCAPPRTAPGY